MARNSATERSEFEDAYRAHYRAIAGFLGRRLSSDVVDDAVADVFAVAWRRRRDMPDPPLGWLLGVASNIAAEQYRARSRLPALIEDARLAAHADRSSVDEEVIARAAMLESLGALSYDDREALLLITWDGASYDDAAAALGCSQATFRVRLTRARKRLRDLLAAAGSDTTSAFEARP